MTEHRNWLITGGCGFIGRSLVKHLLEEEPNCNIKVLDNLLVGTREDLAEVCDFEERGTSKHHSKNHVANSVELVVGDVRDYGKCFESCDGIDIVVHLAASTGVAPSVADPRMDMENNVVGTFNMLEASRLNKVKKFIFASSGAPLGEVDPPIHEEKVARPVSPYGASKLACEGYCSAYYRAFGLKTVMLRFGNVFGPLSGHKNSIVARFFKRALTGETLEIYGDGNQTRDFLYINDLVQAVMLSTKTDIGGEIFQIATQKETTVNEIATKIGEIVYKETGKMVNIVYGQKRTGDVMRNFMDVSKAKKIIGWLPAHDLDSGLNESYKYFMERQN